LGKIFKISLAKTIFMQKGTNEEPAFMPFCPLAFWQHLIVGKKIRIP
jgi:hypothetical protein